MDHGSSQRRAVQNDVPAGVPVFRLVALAATGAGSRSTGEQQAQLLRDKDLLLRELQHASQTTFR
jgi:hypothetical protein